MHQAKTSRPLISVIVPVYNTKEYLPQTMSSLLAQSYSQLEIILVDDGSPDGAGEVCDALAGTDARIRVIHQENRGVSAARNRGLEVAAGDYMGFVDSDDELLPTMYETLLTHLMESGSDLAACNTVMRTADGQESLSVPAYESQVITGREAFREMQYLRKIDSSPCNKLFRRELIGELRFTEGLKLYEDYEFLCQLFFRAQRVALCGEALYIYEQREGSAMQGGYLKAGTAVDRLFMNTKRLPELRGDRDGLRAVICFCDTHLMAVVMQLIRDGNSDKKRLNDIRRSLKKSWRIYRMEKEAPLRFRVGAGMLIGLPGLFSRLAGILYPGKS